ncbi:MAG: response regulator [bacterium]
MEEKKRPNRPSLTVCETTQGRGETFLLVDDEPMIPKIGGQVLAHFGYKVLEAGTAAEALDVSARYTGDIHLLLSDIMMPGMNGWQLAAKLSETRKGILCLFMSGYAVDVLDEARLYGRKLNFLPKPVKGTDLAYKVRELLDSRQSFIKA